jgi:type VI secretion system protein ImpA
MPVREDILAPIPGANPSGVDLIDAGDAVIHEIRDSRKEDPPGTTRREDDPPPKIADWGRVLKLCNDTLATKSKDLEIAGYLVEALFKREGLPGFRAGLAVVQGLVEGFWDTLNPPLDPTEDPPYAGRVSRLGWLGDRYKNLGKRNNRSDLQRGYMHPYFQVIPLTKAGHGLGKYNEARDVGAEADKKSPKEKQARQEKIDAGKLSWEEFQRGLDETPKDFYKALRTELTATQQSLDALRNAVKAKVPDYQPGPAESDLLFSALQDEITELLQLTNEFLAKKLETDPDPVEIQLEPEAAAAGGSAAAADASTPMSEPKSADEAAQRIGQLAEYLRKFAPTNPASYLMLRGLRWGELRASGPELEPRLLIAPPTHVRSLLKGLFLDHKWKDLLEQGERVMARPDGRGWLDLQRHVVTACDQLGPEYERVSAAIKSELALLLRDIPSLLDATLMDDTPTANAETRGWLRDRALLPDGAEVPASEGAALVASRAPRQTHDMVYERAMESAKAGQPQQAIELLMHEAARERSERGRFLRMTQVASIMVSADLKAMALPILDDLENKINAQRSLDAWENGSVVAQPLALLYRCLPESSGRRDDLYQLVCRLDPVVAMSLG